MPLIKYVGPQRPGVETPEGTRFEYDRAVEVPDELAKELLKRPDFKPAKAPKEEVKR
ncbi:MAG: hypothetical protein QME79_12305 [Bacillota bacterium]|nr:hypothetical protein [Bacillota bacterium]